MPGCPQCGTTIQETWDWCEACGFDPEGLKPAGWRPAVAAHERPATAPRAAVPPPGFGDAPPGARPQGRTTAGGYAAGGHRPPPYAPPAQAGFAAPGAFGPGPATPYAPYGSPPPGASGGSTAVKVIGIVGVSFVLLLVVLVGAVTLLGKNASSKFSRIDTAIGVPTVPLPTTTTPPVWTPWTSPDGKFTADFPGVPRLLDNPPGARTVSVAEAQLVVGNALYDAGTAELKPEYYYPNDEAGLTKAINIAAEQFKVTVLAPTMGNFAGVNYMDAMITGTLDGTTVRGSTRVFVVGQRIFYAVAFSTDGSHDFTRFVDSFRQL